MIHDLNNLTSNQDSNTIRRTFEIEWPVDCGLLWMNRDNLIFCLEKVIKNAQITVADVTGDGFCDPTPRTVKL